MRYVGFYKHFLTNISVFVQLSFCVQYKSSNVCRESSENNIACFAQVECWYTMQNLQLWMQGYFSTFRNAGISLYSYPQRKTSLMLAVIQPMIVKQLLMALTNMLSHNFIICVMLTIKNRNSEIQRQKITAIKNQLHLMWQNWEALWMVYKNSIDESTWFDFMNLCFTR